MDTLHRPAPGPGHLDRRQWWATLRRMVREFSSDNLTDWAAALTYYAVLSIFPGLVLLASVLGLIGRTAIDPLIASVERVAPGPAGQIITDGLQGLNRDEQAAGALAVVGLAGALWSASGYVGAFMRASNSIYDVPEGRPLWKTLPLRVGVTVVVGAMLAASALIVVFTGAAAEWLGDLIGLGDTAVAVWGIAKWPVLALLVSAILGTLYWASPNARQAGFRWVTPGGVVAVVLWVGASLGFAVYAANFGSYNKTYGTLGGVAVFLVWLWISNIAILLGAELDAELHRTRAITGGHPADEEPYVPLRDTRALDERERERLRE